MIIKPEKISNSFALILLTAAMLSVPILSVASDAIDKNEQEEAVVDESIISEEANVEVEIAQDVNAVVSSDEKTSKELVSLAWAASSKNSLEEIERIVNQIIDLYGADARLQQAELEDFPARGSEDNYASLNDVATCLFVRAEAIMNNGRTKEAIEKFQEIIDDYKFSQSWDPRGWYWSVAEKSQESIDVLTGKAEDNFEKTRVKSQRTRPSLHTKGTSEIVDYTLYGKFLNVGSSKYKYSISDMEGLAAAVGEGIYPNTGAVYKNPRYKKLKKAKKLEGNHWDFVNTDDLEAAYFKWLTAPEPWGIRMFYVGMIFEKAGMYHEALKAYHSLVVHFPKTVGYTYWQTPWYPGQAAIAKIRHIIRMHPELNLHDKWMKITVANGFDNTADNDVISTWPGKIEVKSVVQKVKEKFNIEHQVPLENVKRRLGEGKVQLVEYDNGHWQMLVEGKPFVIKGITYDPTKIGQSPDKGTLANWMEEDTNGNGLPDGPYDSWVDENRNNKQDENEPVVGDFKLMSEMGLNTMRLYYHPRKPIKEVLRKMYEEYGIRVIMGNFMGKYTVGSGATWSEGTDYENETHKKTMLESVKAMVNEYKDEPYIIMWLLGNENNYGVASNADKKPRAYFEFVNEVAKWIKSVDPDHPVAVNNGDTLFLDIFAEVSPDVDAFAANVYRGDYGFGSFWDQVKQATGKPGFITEYGAPAYADHMTLEEAEQAQADYHKGNWMDIEENFAGNSRGVGNSIGGVVFEWLDEWWKNYEPFRHDRKSDAVGPFPGGYYFEEWFGIVSQGNGSHSPFLRQLRPSYFVYKELWNK